MPFEIGKTNSICYGEFGAEKCEFSLHFNPVWRGPRRRPTKDEANNKGLTV